MVIGEVSMYLCIKEIAFGKQEVFQFDIPVMTLIDGDSRCLIALETPSFSKQMFLRNC